MSYSQKKLRLITYLTPGLPLSLYQTYQYYLEEALGCDSVLMVESRASGPLSGRPNPFTTDEVDIAFMCSTSYLQQVSDQVSNVELLPAAPIHRHPNSDLRPVYYSDIIIHKEKIEQFKTFHDLKGHKWAYNDEQSLSGTWAVLVELRRRGLNASFFGHLIHSGSHHNSIELVLNRTVDAASIDSSVLQAVLAQKPEYSTQLHTLASLGPLPIQPVVINSRLPDDLKAKICQAFLDMNKSDKWRAELEKFNVWGFKSIDSSLYDKETEIQQLIREKNLSMHSTYY